MVEISYGCINMNFQETLGNKDQLAKPNAGTLSSSPSPQTGSLRSLRVDLTAFNAASILARSTNRTTAVRPLVCRSRSQTDGNSAPSMSSMLLPPLPRFLFLLFLFKVAVGADASSMPRPFLRCPSNCTSSILPAGNPIWAESRCLMCISVESNGTLTRNSDREAVGVGIFGW